MAQNGRRQRIDLYPDEIVVDIAGHARAVLVRVRTAAGRNHAEIRLRVALVDNEPTARRGVALRGGIVAGVDLPAARDILDDLRAVWVAGERGQHWDTLATRLTARFPEAYASLTAEALSALVRAKGIESRNVKANGSTRRGVYLADIIAAVDQRDRDAG